MIGVIASSTIEGEWEVYAENTTGKEPMGGVGGQDNPTHAKTSQLLRFTTKDFVSYTEPKTGQLAGWPFCMHAWKMVLVALLIVESHELNQTVNPVTVLCLSQ